MCVCVRVRERSTWYSQADCLVILPRDNTLEVEASHHYISVTTHTHTHTHTHTFTYIHIHTYIHTYIHTATHTDRPTDTHTDTHTHTHTQQTDGQTHRHRNKYRQLAANFLIVIKLSFGSCIIKNLIGASPTLVSNCIYGIYVIYTVHRVMNYAMNL